MTPFPKPRGFWDYALFALVLTGALALLFWLWVRERFGWADVALASFVAVLCVLVIILARRGERAKWIAQTTWHVHALASLGALALVLGALYADAYLLHRRETNSNWPGDYTVIAIVVTAVTISSFLGRHRSKRELL
jgi:hypothetical protein